MTFDSSTILSQSSGALATEIDGEVVLIGIETGQYYGLDAIGSVIWRRLDQPCAVDALCAGLQADFDGDAATIERETLAFLDQLATRNLITTG